jgi:GR25 family glycosyltransferase involved in LPS biosynthesis
VFGDGVDGSILTSQDVHEKHKAIPFQDLALEDTDEAFKQVYGDECWNGLTHEGRDQVCCSCVLLLLGWHCDLSPCMFTHKPQARLCYTRQLTRGELGCALSHIHAWRWIKANWDRLNLDFAIVMEDDCVIEHKHLADCLLLLWQLLKSPATNDKIDIAKLSWCQKQTSCHQAGGSKDEMPSSFVGFKKASEMSWFAGMYAITRRCAKDILPFMPLAEFVFPVDDFISALGGVHLRDDFNKLCANMMREFCKLDLEGNRIGLYHYYGPKTVHVQTKISETSSSPPVPEFWRRVTCFASKEETLLSRESLAVVRAAMTQPPEKGNTRRDVYVIDPRLIFDDLIRCVRWLFCLS